MNHKTGWIALALGLSAGSAALAQSSPYYIGASQAFGHVSNVRNAPDDQPATSDNYGTTTLRAGLDQPFGRQRFYVDGLARRTRYNDANDLDNNGYDVRAGLDWATIERLSGGLVFGSTQSLSRLNPGNAPVATTRNLERTNHAEARFRLGGEGRLALDGSLGYRRVDYTAPEFEPREYDQGSASAGVSYRPGGALTLSTGVSGQKSKYPRFLQVSPGEYQADRADRRDIYLGAYWVPSGLSTVNARVSYSKIEYDLATVNDFSGLTGLLSWAWQPTGRLQFVTTASRETGQDASFVTSAAAATGSSSTPGSTPTTPGTPGAPGTGTTAPTTTPTITAADFSRVTNSLGLRALYELTAKIRLDAGITFARRNLGDGTGAGGTDKTTGYSVGAFWTPTRSLGFGCSYTRDARTSSTTLSSDYHANAFSCVGQLMLR